MGPGLKILDRAHLRLFLGTQGTWGFRGSIQTQSQRGHLWATGKPGRPCRRVNARRVSCLLSAAQCSPLSEPSCVPAGHEGWAGAARHTSVAGPGDALGMRVRSPLAACRLATVSLRASSRGLAGCSPAHLLLTSVDDRCLGAGESPSLA